MDCSESDISGNESKGSLWSAAEHQSFLNAYQTHGKDWRKVTAEVGTRTITQVRSHAQKYFLKLKRHALKAGHTPQPSPSLQPSLSSEDQRLMYQNNLMRSYIQTLVRVNGSFVAEMERLLVEEKEGRECCGGVSVVTPTPVCYGDQYKRGLYWM